MRYPDGYIQLLDRAKDIIISGGENISTIEVENALMSHPAVADVAVIAVPDDRWGERPKAFVVLAAGQHANQAELIAHVKEQIAKFKAPKAVTSCWKFLGRRPVSSANSSCATTNGQDSRATGRMNGSLPVVPRGDDG